MAKKYFGDFAVASLALVPFPMFYNTLDGMVKIGIISLYIAYYSFKYDSQ